MFKGYSSSRNKTESTPAPTPSYGETEVPSEWIAPSATTPEPAAQGGFFGGAGAEPQTSPFATSAAVAPTAVASRNVLNSDVSVVGVLRFTDDLLVDGSVEGEITSDGELTVGANATIQAGDQTKVAVRTRSAIIHGRVSGDVVVTDRVELSSTAELVGDVTAAKISIQEGAVFIGHCKVGVGTVTAMPAAAPAKKTKTAKSPVENDLLG